MTVISQQCEMAKYVPTMAVSCSDIIGGNAALVMRVWHMTWYADLFALLLVLTVTKSNNSHSALCTAAAEIIS